MWEFEVFRANFWSDAKAAGALIYSGLRSVVYDIAVQLNS